MTEQMKQALDKTIMKLYPSWQDTNNHDVDAMEQMMIRVQRRAFKNGIDWYINNLWHDANKEQPKLGSSVLISKDWKHFEVSHSILRVYEDRFWCYIEDLFPTIEEERK